MNDKELHNINEDLESVKLDWEFCPICGHKIPKIKNLKFCTKCGHPTSKATAQPSQTEELTQRLMKMMTEGATPEEIAQLEKEVMANLETSARAANQAVTGSETPDLIDVMHNDVSYQQHPILKTSLLHRDVLLHHAHDFSRTCKED